jgi:hypothetical protein
MNSSIPSLDALGGTRHVVHGDADGLAFGPVDRTVREPAESDLRALQVGQNSDRSADGVGRSRTASYTRWWSAR